MNSGKPEDSFARLNFHPGADAHHACLVQSYVVLHVFTVE